MLNRQLSFLDCSLQGLFPRPFRICDKNSRSKLSASCLKLDWVFVWRPVAIFNAGASCAVKPTPSFILANILCVLRKSNWNPIYDGVDICQISRTFLRTQILLHDQCPRALTDFVDDYHSKSMNTTFYALYKALFEHFLQLFSLYAAQLLVGFSMRIYNARMEIYFYSNAEDL